MANFVWSVLQGIDVFDPKFNIVSPGADPDVYFPYTQTDRRLTKFHPELKDLLFGGPETGKSVGQLKNKDKPIIFRCGWDPPPSSPSLPCPLYVGLSQRGACIKHELSLELCLAASYFTTKHYQ